MSLSLHRFPFTFLFRFRFRFLFPFPSYSGFWFLAFPHAYTIYINELETWLMATLKMSLFNPFPPGDFAKEHVLKLVKRFSGHCRAIKN